MYAVRIDCTGFYESLGEKETEYIRWEKFINRFRQVLIFCLTYNKMYMCKNHENMKEKGKNRENNNMNTIVM